MSGNCTLLSFVLFSFVYFLGGAGPEKSVAQCGIEITHWDVIGEFERNDSIFKKVKVIVENPGFGSKYYYLIDGEKFSGPNNHDVTPYKYSTEIEIYIDAQKIVFLDFNVHEACQIEKTLDFEPNVCRIKIEAKIDLRENCESFINFEVTDGQTIESAGWIRQGTTDTVHRELNWDEIPPGYYEIFAISTDGCVYDLKFDHCTEQSNAGRNITEVYCLDQEEALDIWSLLDPDVDVGKFHTLDGDVIDDDEMRYWTWDGEEAGTFQYRYITHVESEIPDTSLITIYATDCDRCEYEILAFRSCEYPDSIEVSILSLNPEIEEIEVVLPDNSDLQVSVHEPFHLYWPDREAPLDLKISGETAAGICDTVYSGGIIPDFDIDTDFQESEASSEDSTIVQFQVLSGGVGPYEVILSYGDWDTTMTLTQAEVYQEVLFRSADEVMVEITDQNGCRQIKTYTLSNHCLPPEVESVPTTCGDSNGRISLDMGALTSESKIQWSEGDRSSGDRWVRSGLAPGMYHYTISYKDCVIKDSVEVLKNTVFYPEVKSENDCLLDGVARFYIPDSLEVNQWFYDGEPLESFSVELPVNMPHSFVVETMEGCQTTVEKSEKETPWLEDLIFEKPGRLVAVPGKDQQYFTQHGWYLKNEELCTSCWEYSHGVMLEEGVYGFFIQQDENCRRDTLFRLQQDDQYFQMPNVLNMHSETNNKFQIFDPLQQMESIIEFSVFDRFGNVLYRAENIQSNGDFSLDWPRSSESSLPDIVLCVARIRCIDGKEMRVSQDVLILQ